MKKRSPFRQTSSNQDGFGIQRNAKRKPVRKKTKKKSVTKKQGETTSEEVNPTPLSELSDQELVTFLASMPVVSEDNLNYLTTSGRLGNLFNTQFNNDDPLFGEQLQSAYNKYGSMVNQMDGGYKYQGDVYGPDTYAENRETLNFDYLQNLSRKEQREEAKLIHDAHSAEIDRVLANQNISKSDYSVPTIMHNIKHHGTPFQITFATDRYTGEPTGQANIRYGRMLTDKQIERQMRNRSTRGRGQLGS